MSAVHVPMGQRFYEPRDSLLRRRSLKLYARFTFDLGNLMMGSIWHIALLSDR
jgi:hypothetical protein